MRKQGLFHSHLYIIVPIIFKGVNYISLDFKPAMIQHYCSVASICVLNVEFGSVEMLTRASGHFFSCK